jgi:hypothetical protein
LKVNKHENLNVFAQKYKCNDCVSYYRSEHDSLVAKYSNYVHEVNNYIKELFSRCLISKNNVSKITNTALEARPSYNTVKYRLHNVVMETKKEMLAIANYVYSGYYGYDEEMVGKGLTLFDTLYDLVVFDEIHDDSAKSTVEKYLERNLNGKPLFGITTDGRKTFIKALWIY